MSTQQAYVSANHISSTASCSIRQHVRTYACCSTSQTGSQYTQACVLKHHPQTPQLISLQGLASCQPSVSTVNSNTCMSHASCATTASRRHICSSITCCQTVRAQATDCGRHYQQQQQQHLQKAAAKHLTACCCVQLPPCPTHPVHSVRAASRAPPAALTAPCGTERGSMHP